MRQVGVLDDGAAQLAVELGDAVGREASAVELPGREVGVDADTGDDLGQALGVDQSAALEARLQHEAEGQPSAAISAKLRMLKAPRRESRGRRAAPHA